MGEELQKHIFPVQHVPTTDSVISNTEIIVLNVFAENFH